MITSEYKHYRECVNVVTSEYRIREIRQKRDISGVEVANKLGISPQYYYDIERGKKNLSADNAVQLADIFKVTLDYLLGKSIGAIIERRLIELGITIEELAKQIDEPVVTLKNIDFAQPAPWDYEPDGLIDRISKVLGIGFKDLSTSFSRQEPPTYDGPQISAKDAFGKEDLRLSHKEERDIAIDLERMIGDLETNEAMAFHGEPMDDETKELMRISLENSLRLAKSMAKQKFNPNKNK
jgi:transcriptional regulator with XRE-family HTH domain